MASKIDAGRPALVFVVDDVSIGCCCEAVVEAVMLEAVCCCEAVVEAVMMMLLGTGCCRVEVGVTDKKKIYRMRL